MDFLSSSTGFLVVIVLPMLLFFIYQIYHLIMISIRLKRAIAVETAKEQAAAAEKAGKTDAQAALEEAKKMKEEAERLKAEAEKALKEARQGRKEKEE